MNIMNNKLLVISLIVIIVIILIVIGVLVFIQYTSTSPSQIPPAVTNMVNILVDPDYIKQTTSSLAVTTAALPAVTTAASPAVTTAALPPNNNTEVTRAVTEAANRIVTQATTPEPEENTTVVTTPSLSDIFNNRNIEEIFTSSRARTLSNDELYGMMNTRGLGILFLYAEKYKNNWERLSSDVENSIRITLGNYGVVADELLRRNLITKLTFLRMRIVIDMYRRCTVNPNGPECRPDYNIDNHLPTTYYPYYYDRNYSFSEYETEIIMPEIQRLRDQNRSLEAEYLYESVLDEKTEHDTRNYNNEYIDNEYIDDEAIIEEEVLNENSNIINETICELKSSITGAPSSRCTQHRDYDSCTSDPFCQLVLQNNINSNYADNNLILPPLNNNYSQNNNGVNSININNSRVNDIISTPQVSNNNMMAQPTQVSNNINNNMMTNTIVQTTQPLSPQNNLAVQNNPIDIAINTHPPNITSPITLPAVNPEPVIETIQVRTPVAIQPQQSVQQAPPPPPPPVQQAPPTYMSTAQVV
jgi:hypothetical protein